MYAVHKFCVLSLSESGDNIAEKHGKLQQFKALSTSGWTFYKTNIFAYIKASHPHANGIFGHLDCFKCFLKSRLLKTLFICICVIKRRVSKLISKFTKP